MYLLVVWQLTFSQPMLKTYFPTEVECRYTGAQFELAYRDTPHPIEFQCFKVGN